MLWGLLCISVKLSFLLSSFLNLNKRRSRPSHATGICKSHKCCSLTNASSHREVITIPHHELFSIHLLSYLLLLLSRESLNFFFFFCRTVRERPRFTFANARGCCSFSLTVSYFLVVVGVTLIT